MTRRAEGDAHDTRVCRIGPHDRARPYPSSDRARMALLTWSMGAWALRQLRCVASGKDLGHHDGLRFQHWCRSLATSARQATPVSALRGCLYLSKFTYSRLD